MARKPGNSRPDNAPEKLAMPDEASVLDYINSCAVPPSLRDITRAFKIGRLIRLVIGMSMVMVGLTLGIIL